LDPKLKKSRPELAIMESDLTEEFIIRYEGMLAEKEEQRVQVKLEKTNEKRKEEGLAPLKELAESKPSQTSLEKLEKKLSLLTERINNQKTQMVDKVHLIKSG
jgi:hypothetical protein